MKEFKAQDIDDFLVDERAVLTADSHPILKRNSEVISKSIERDINSIDYADVQYISSGVLSKALYLALNSDYILSNKSPYFFTANVELVLRSLKKDIKLIDYADDSVFHELDNETKNWIYEELGKVKYIPNYNSPEFIKGNFDYIYSLVKENAKFIDIVDLDYFSDDESNLIAKELIRQGYVINSYTPYKIYEFSDVILSSVKSDMESIKFICNSDIKGNPELFKYLLEKKYNFNEEFFEYEPISFLKNEEILRAYLDSKGLHEFSYLNNDDRLFYDRIKNLLSLIINSSLEVRHVSNFAHARGEDAWHKYKAKNIEYFDSIAKRICSAIEAHSNFNEALDSLRFWHTGDFRYYLDDDYLLFSELLRNYHNAYYGNASDKMDKIQEFRNEITRLSAKYTARRKEMYLKDSIDEKTSEFCNSFFKVNVNSKYIKDSLVLRKQIEKLLKTMNSTKDYKSVLNEIKEIIVLEISDIYKEEDKNKLEEYTEMILENTLHNGISAHSFYEKEHKPARFDEFIEFEEASKLINRLNSNYISYDGKEILNYKNLIGFDGKKYIYTGTFFTSDEFSKIKEYKELLHIHKKLNSNLVSLARTITEYEPVNNSDLARIKSQLPFSDDNFIFNDELYGKVKINELDKFADYIFDYKAMILNDNLYQNILSLFIDNGLSAYLLLERIRYNEGLSSFVVNMPNIIKMLGKDQISESDINMVLQFNELFNNVGLEEISILGTEVAKQLITNTAYMANGFNGTRIVNAACDLICGMTKKDSSTVPYISGENKGYKYSMFDNTDETVLTSGIKTATCFKLLGYGNDFLHYCALNKNGFVIKITDEEDKFVARASGFRNGNVVFINQLNTIYSTDAYDWGTVNNEIIETFKMACNDIIRVSKENEEKEDKIDFIFASTSGPTEDMGSPLPNEVIEGLPAEPYCNKEDGDWESFKENQNLTDDFFTDLRCMACICADKPLSIENLHFGDRPAIYKRKRHAVVSTKISQDLANKIQRIRAMKARTSHKEFKYEEIPTNLDVITGDNWYILLKNYELVDCMHLSSDHKAKKECEKCLSALKEIQEQNLYIEPGSDIVVKH